MTIFTATAHTNIALIKYWGKSADEGNLPATGSLSLTLDRFFTTTSLEAIDAPLDQFYLNDTLADLKHSLRVSQHLDFMRTLASRKERFLIRSRNHVPTSAGLASSASGFAALTLAASRALKLELGAKELSRIARRGSGSAARSFFAGFTLMHGGPQIDDEGAFAEPIKAEITSNLRMVVVQCAQGPKAIGSREAMKLTEQSSVFYQAFLANHSSLLNRAVAAAKKGDFEELGSCMEQSTLQMHATMLGCPEPFWYLNATTLSVMDEVKALRRGGVPCYFTMDAGPHVKVLCMAEDANRVEQHLGCIDGVSKITACASGPAAYAHD